MARFRVGLLWVALLAALALQLSLSQHLRQFRPAIEEMPFPPSDMALKAMALGDDQFLFRVWSRWLQDVGDGGGRVRPLRDYDYTRVVDWLRAVDKLDRRSDYVYMLGSRYFGAITDPAGAPPRVAILARFFAEAAMADPVHRWPWLVWAAEKARHVIKDATLSDRLAQDLVSLRAAPGVPDWLPLLAVPLYRQAGEDGKAAELTSDSELMGRRRHAFEELTEKLRAMGAIEP